jgi:hypothetical protein
VTDPVIVTVYVPASPLVELETVSSLVEASNTTNELGYDPEAT